MIKRVKHLFLVVAFLCGGILQAQTTDLIYHLGSSGSSVNIASVATDAGGNIFVCGSATGSSIEFNPLGTSTLKNAGTGGSGFIAKYNSSGILQTVIIFGANINNKGIKVFVDPAKQNVYLLANIYGSGVKLDPLSGFGTNGLAGSMAIAKYDNALVFKSQKIFNDGVGYIGDVLNDIAISGSDLYITGSLFDRTTPTQSTGVEFNPGGTSKKLLSTGGYDIIIAKYDTTTLSNTWAYNVGGLDDDGGTGIDLDNTGNIYLSGYFTGQNIDIDPQGPKTLSDASTIISGSADAFVAKYNASMTCQWAFNIGAGLADRGNDVLVDKTSGNVFIGGIVKDDALDVYFDPTTTASASFSGIGLNDIFVASYTSGGTYNWHLATGSSGEEDLTSLAFDLGGNIVVSGFASGTVNFGSSKTITGLGGKDAYFAIISGTSGLATAAYNLGGGSDEQANGVTVASSGKILVAGSYKGTGDYNIGAAATIPASGTQDGFISRHVLCSPPSITSQPSSTTKCEGTAASFTVGATGATSYQWKKGATTISGATNATYSIPAVAIAQAGSYTVDVTNACQTATSSAVSLTVNPKPSITSAATSSACSGSSVGYGITSDVAGTYSWTRATVSGITPTTGGGNTASISEVLTNSTLLPVNVDYIIIPTATTGSCVGSSFTLTVTVNPKPSITSSSTASACSGATFNYGITSSVASSYSWTRALKAGITPNTGSGLVTPISETLTNSTASPITVDYIITPTATTGGCAGSPFTLTVTVNPSVTPTITATSSATTICSGASITLTANSTNAGVPTYKWKLGSGYISGATNATFSTTGAVNGDVYSVEMTSTAACSSPTVVTSSGVTITVNPSVTPTITATSSPTTICAGQSIVLTASATNGGTPTYKWKLGSGYISGATNSTYVTSGAANGDVYSVEMTSTVACATPATVTSSGVAITVNPSFTPTITATSSATTICAGGSITLSSTFTNGGTPTYKWKLGSAYISGATNANYTTAGASNGDVYSVEMTSTAACASPATVTSTGVTITVSSSVAPTVTATSSATTICAGASITLSSTSTGGGTPTYKWKLGSAYISGATNATYTTTGAANGDVYSLEMTSSLACALPATVTSTGVTITVNSPVAPTVTVTSSATSICTGTSITLSSTSTGGGTPTYKWKLGSAYISGATNASYTTTGATNGDVYSLEMTSTAACASPAIVTSTGVTITVGSTVAPTITATSSATTICTGTSITLSSTSTGGGTPTYKWKLGSSYIAGATNASYTTTAAANGDVYSLEMTSSLACASPAVVTSTGVTITVTSTVAPTVGITSSATTICTGASLTLTANPTNGGTPTYKWKLGSGYISGATNSTYTTSGALNGNVYSVEMISTLACASPATVTSAGVTITVNSTVAPTIIATSSATTICTGTSITLSSTFTNGGTPTYKWKLGSAYISGATNGNYTTTSAANGDVYSVEMTSTAACASPAVVTSTGVTITVNSSVVPTVNATSSATTICAGASITLSSTFTNGGTPTYKWKLGSAYISGATNASYTTTGAANGDVYSLEMTSTAACASPAVVTSTGITITVGSTVVPTITATSSATTICAGASITLSSTSTGGGTPTYKWKLGSAYISGATNATYTTTAASNNDSYTLEMTSSSSCASPAVVTSSAVVITVNPTLVPVVTISTASATICSGDVITFTSAATNPGSTPSYVWRKNGIAITPAATGTSYSTTGAVNGDIYSVAMTSNALCASPSSDVSNTISVTVNPLPAITGLTTVCSGSTITLTGSGTANVSNPWVSSATSIATVTNGGVVTGVAAGTSDITYTNNNGCSQTITITVNATPTITGTISLCIGSTTQLTGSGTAASSNPWISASPSKATVDNNGLVNGIASGTSIITYTTSTGCSKTVTVTVNPLPTITGTATVCAGFTTQLTGSGTADATNPWVSATTSVATVSNSGLITGIAGGTSVITYKNSNGCSVTQTVTVNPATTPIVSITANNSNICIGTSITFTATPTDGGTAPTYKWKLGSGYISGATNATYTTTAATNGDSYSVEMTSNALCASTSIVTSNAIVISVTTSVTPTVTVAAVPGNSICVGSSVTFTATPGNGGTAPTYQWKKNGSNISAATNATFTTSSLITNDQISVDIVSNSTCASTLNASSSPITMVVNPVVSAIVTLTASSTTVCTGGGVTFTTSYTNEGSTPLFEWFVNNVSQGAPSSSDTYTSATLTNGAQVLVKMTSSETCVTTATVSSNSVTITVTPIVTPTVSITSDKSKICAGGSVIYTATPVNGGTASYQWKVDGTNAGLATTSNTFITSTLTDGDVVTVVLTSSITCVTSPTATSVGLTIEVAPATQIGSQPSDQSVCALGNNVTFSVGATGDNLSYQWKAGSTNLANNATYTGVLTKDLSISNVSNADLLGYKVTVTGTCGTLTSNVATLTLSTSSINITTQPVAQVLEVGDMIQLSVSATGPTLSYQWKKNGVDLVNDSRISGANTSSLQISNALVSDSDNNYTCLIMSPCAAQLSSNATSVTVSAATSTQDALAQGFMIAPNPSAGHFTLSNNYSPFIVEELEIISMEGIVVARKTIAGTTNLSEEVYAQDLPKGMYLLVIKGEGEQAVLKLIFDK